MLLHPAGNLISATVLFSAGSIRESVVLSSVNTQMLSAELATPARTLSAPVFNVFETFPVLPSILASVPSPQFSTQTLPKPDCGLAQGLFNSETGSMSLLDFGSIRASAFFAGFATRMD